MRARCLMDLTLDELAARLKPAFRAKQVMQWVYQRYADSFDAMDNIPKTLRTELAQNFTINPLTIVKKERSSDGSEKYLFRLHDGHTVETVLLLMREETVDDEAHTIEGARYTVCVSTQVGCKVGCAFCLTAKGGFVRNLTPGEIVAQVLSIKKEKGLEAKKRLNIVYMGMGEPLDNLENVAKAVKILAMDEGLSISPRRQTISTSGLSTKIEKLGEMNLGVQLAISLHAVDDDLRAELIPMNKAYNIASIMKAVRKFPVDERKRVMFEYLVIKGVNDDDASARKLVKLLHGIKAKVNLIYFNPYPGSHYQRPGEADMVRFQEYLLSKGITCTIRSSRGIDISAACGQLREQELSEGTCR